LPLVEVIRKKTIENAQKGKKGTVGPGKKKKKETPNKKNGGKNGSKGPKKSNGIWPTFIKKFKKPS